jgi:serine/threonine protein kinase
MAHFIDINLLGPVLLLCLALTLLNLGWSWARHVEVRPVPALATAGRPQQLGPYTLASKIGEGAMGEVYRAWNPALGDWRAIKLLPRGASARDRQRFEKEARLGAALNHPNTVSIFERGEGRDGTCYYAMELLEGVNLQQLVERDGPQSPERVVQILLQLCAALEQTHEQGLVHRDIKPENVLLTGPELEVAKLIDFGLVEHLGTVAEGQPEGTLIGTPLYISPEAILAPETVGARSDLYGLGAVAYFLLRGKPVFHGRSVVEVCSHHLHTLPESLSEALDGAISAELERIVLDCLAKDPADRPASAAELAQRLAGCIESVGPRESGLGLENETEFENETVFGNEAEFENESVFDSDRVCGNETAFEDELGPCLAFMRAHRMLDRLDAVLRAQSTGECCIAA